MIHESAVWSTIHKKWFFLPRRSSRSAYDEVADEYRGTNILLIANPNFTEITVSYDRGFVHFQPFPFFFS